MSGCSSIRRQRVAAEASARRTLAGLRAACRLTLMLMLGSTPRAARAGLAVGADQLEEVAAEIEHPAQQDDRAAARVWGLSGFAFFSANATPNADDAGLQIGLAQAMLTGTWGVWELQLAPRFTLAPTEGLQADYSTDLFFQNLSLGLVHPRAALRIGRLQQRIGRQVDYGFYGSILRDWELKGQADLGLEVSGSVPLRAESVELTYVLQAFWADGRAIQRGPDSPWRLHWRPERHRVVASELRARWQLAEGRNVQAYVGGQAFTISPLPAGTPGVVRSGRNQVSRLVVGAEGRARWLEGFLELGHQRGTSRISGRPVPAHAFLWTGFSLRLGHAQPHYHFSVARPFASSGQPIELLHELGVVVPLNRHVAILGEVALHEHQGRQDQSLGRDPHKLFVVLNGAY